MKLRDEICKICSSEMSDLGHTAVLAGARHIKRALGYFAADLK